MNTLRSSIAAVYSNHKDIHRIRPLECSILCIGNKYDTLKALPLNEKRLLLQCLRFICHYFGMTLLCTNLNDTSSKDIHRSAISNAAFNVATKNAFEVNDKVVYITRGMDSFENILLGKCITHAGLTGHSASYLHISSISSWYAIRSTGANLTGEHDPSAKVKVSTPPSLVVAMRSKACMQQYRSSTLSTQLLECCMVIVSHGIE